MFCKWNSVVKLCKINSYLLWNYCRHATVSAMPAAIFIGKGEGPRHWPAVPALLQLRQTLQMLVSCSVIQAYNTWPQ